MEAKTSVSNFHLSYSDRTVIEFLISERKSLSVIAKLLNRDPSTILREIQRNSCPYEHCNSATPCFFSNKKCYYYKASYAHALSEKRQKYNHNYSKLSDADIALIDQLVAPLLIKGHSFEIIANEIGTSISVSASTLRRLYCSGQLPQTLAQMKKISRKYSLPSFQEEQNLSLTDARFPEYSYDSFLKNVPDIKKVVQMDTIRINTSKKQTVLSLYFVESHMQLFILCPNDSDCSITGMLNDLERILSFDLYHKCFPILLTDHGDEFKDAFGIEHSVHNVKRSDVYYCDAMKPEQKGSCERNHIFFRMIVPAEGNQVELDAELMLRITNHINSYPRKSLGYRCPYEVAMESLPKEFFELLGLQLIPLSSVNLTPSLISQ